MSKQRSPNYPQLSLTEALERIRKIYTAKHTVKTTQDEIAKVLGYGGLNGSSMGVISALRKYGLLQGSNEALNVSHDAVMILERQSDHPERIAALRKAAYSPALFSEIHEQFADQTPSDEDLRIYLVGRGFSRRAVDEVIRTYRDTVELVAEPESEYNAVEMKPQAQPQQTGQSIQGPPYYGASIETQRMMNPTLDNQMRVQELAQEMAAESLNTRISPDCRARVFFDGPVTQEGLDKLIKYLELAKDDYPSIKGLWQKGGLGKLYNNSGEFLCNANYYFYADDRVKVEPEYGWVKVLKENPELTLELDNGQRVNLLQTDKQYLYALRKGIE